MLLALIIWLLVLSFYQDVRFRGIHWAIFPLLLVITFAFRYAEINYEDILLSVSFTISVLIGLTIYLSIKNLKLIDITNGYFSWGDILMLFAITPLFSVFQFIVFFIVGTILSLLIYLISVQFTSGDRGVPYAGYMALICIPFIIFEDQLNQLIATYYVGY